MEGLYTAKEARNKLGVTVDKFQYMVRTGQVKKVVLPGRKYGMYARSQIDELAKSLSAFSEQYQEGEKNKPEYPIFFRPATPRDITSMEQFARNVSARRGEDHEYTVSPPLFSSLPMSKFSYVFMRNDDVVGYFTIIPLKHDVLMKFMHNKLRDEDIRQDIIAEFEPGEPIDCIIWEIVSDPTKKCIGAYIIRKILKFFHTLGKQGVEIVGAYTIALSRDSRYYCRRVGMHRMEHPTTQTDWIPFEMKVKETTNRYTRNYLQALRSYKVKQLRNKRELRKVKYPKLKAAAHAEEHRKGTAASEYGRYEEALAAFEQAIQLDPNNTDAYFGKGAALKLLGRAQEAGHAYKQAEHLMGRSKQHETK